MPNISAKLLATEYPRLAARAEHRSGGFSRHWRAIIGHEVARALGARFIFTERDAEGKMALRRGFSVEFGEAAVVVEDVVTTGGSTREVVSLLKESGARVLGAGCHHRQKWRQGRSRCAAHCTEDAGSHYLSARELPIVPRRCSRCEAGIAAGGCPCSSSNAWLPRRIESSWPTTAPIITVGRCSRAFQPFRALSKQIVSGIEGKPVHVAGSGRTDAGVHALAQVAAFSIENPIPVEQSSEGRSTVCCRATFASTACKRPAGFPSTFRCQGEDLRIPNFRGRDLFSL